MLNCLNEILTFSDNITILFKRDTMSFENIICLGNKLLSCSIDIKVKIKCLFPASVVCIEFDIIKYTMTRVMRNIAFCTCGDCAADQRLCFAMKIVQSIYFQNLKF